MLSQLDYDCKTAVMKILAAIYESGLLPGVETKTLVELFTDGETDAPLNYIDFESEDFLNAYVSFKEEEIAGLLEAADYFNNELQHSADQFREDSFTEFYNNEADPSKKNLLH